MTIRGLFARAARRLTCQPPADAAPVSGGVELFATFGSAAVLARELRRAKQTGYRGEVFEAAPGSWMSTARDPGGEVEITVVGRRPGRMVVYVDDETADEMADALDVAVVRRSRLAGGGAG